MIVTQSTPPNTTHPQRHQSPLQLCIKCGDRGFCHYDTYVSLASYITRQSRSMSAAPLTPTRRPLKRVLSGTDTGENSPYGGVPLTCTPRSLRFDPTITVMQFYAKDMACAALQEEWCTVDLDHRCASYRNFQEYQVLRLGYKFDKEAMTILLYTHTREKVADWGYAQDTPSVLFCEQDWQIFRNKILRDLLVPSLSFVYTAGWRSFANPNRCYYVWVDRSALHPQAEVHICEADITRLGNLDDLYVWDRRRETRLRLGWGDLCNMLENDGPIDRIARLF